MKLITGLFLALLLTGTAVAQQQVINTGTAPNYNNGDQARTWAQKDNANFGQLYGMFGPSSQLSATGTAAPTDIGALWGCSGIMQTGGTCVSMPGTVTSVGLSDGSTTPIFVLSGTPVTSGGTLTFTLRNESANTVLAGPTTGSAAQPAFRSLVSADLPLTITGLTSVSSTTFVGALTGNASTATALAATPSGCAAGSGFATTIAASGNLGCTASITGPLTITAPASGDALTVTGTTGGLAASFKNPSLTSLTTGGNGVMTLGVHTSGADTTFVFTDGVTYNEFISGIANHIRFQPATAGTVAFDVGTNAILMPSIASSTAAQTGAVCWATGGSLTYDPTNTCLVSSNRYKQDVQNLDEGLDAVMRLRPVTYQLKDLHDRERIGAEFGGNATQIGFVAEEVQKIDPRLTPLDEQGKPRSVEYAQMSALLTRAIQQQQHEIIALWIAVALLFTWSIWLTRAIRGTKKP